MSTEKQRVVQLWYKLTELSDEATELTVELVNKCKKGLSQIVELRDSKDIDNDEFVGLLLKLNNIVLNLENLPQHSQP